MKLVDTHCHLHRSEYDADRPAVLERAKAAGVIAIIDPAVEADSNEQVLKSCAATPEVYGAVGLHPNHAGEWSEDFHRRLRGWAGAEKVVAIGEVGLDYYRQTAPRETQQKVLARLLSLAAELDKPVILHCRDAGLPGEGTGEIYRDLFRILRGVGRPLRGVLHCFAGPPEAALQGIEMGLLISFAGNLTFKKGERLRQTARSIPFDKVVLETDGPFLAPQARRGSRNEPAFLTELVKTWTEILDLTPEDIARVTTVNAHFLFGVGPAPERGRIAYPIRHSLYINLTNACTDRCVFCALSVDDFWKGEGTSPFVKGHHLRMRRDPTVAEILEAAGDPSGYEEVVFCGYGEPMIRLKELLEAARGLKARGARRIRVNTNGHGNLIHKRSIAPELKGAVDECSVSLNTPDAESYLQLCRPHFGLAAYDGIKTFIRECRDAGLKVVATAVGMPGVDIPACRRVAEEELKVPFRERTYNDLG
ncbi:MAG: radical SAM protein [Candidatus Omnitrophica bacterium CG11_big_fil_rev_8_21_14_0_20_64_10]|nr:MAG: radical SAM protein [Candidatus Omnitrophica bacterium CG11_big_fil_rev_8_21_14_0_20_64_10]